MSQNSNTTESIGLSIVGYGGMGSQHAVMLKPVEELRLIGTYDIREERQEAAKSLGCKVFPSLTELLADQDTEIVLIATPNHTHKDIALQSLRAGKHVICEKPAMLSSSDLQEVLNVAQECGRVFVVHQNRRWDEDFCVIKKIYQEGTIGKIFNIESRTHGSQGIPGDWRAKIEFGGGMLLDWGVHLIDQILSMVDERIIKVYCRLSHILGGECDDAVHLYLTFESGMTALIEVSTWNFDILPRWYVNGMWGTAIVRDFWFKMGNIVRLTEDVKNNTKPIEAGKGITKTMAMRDPDTLESKSLPRIPTDVRDFYRNVAETIRGESELIVKPEQSLRVLRLIEAARRSNELEQVVDFE